MLQRPPSQSERSVLRYREGRLSADADVVAAEEPMEIRLLWQEGTAARRESIAVTMRTPGNDFELAAGFLFGEGILRRHDDLADVSYCTDEDEEQTFNIVNVTLRPGIEFDVSRLERHFYTTSSCGVCGKAALEAVEVQGCEVLPPGPSVNAETLCTLPDALRAAQEVFERTGGLHAAGLFTASGRLLGLREDVGRHNAVDKLIGEQYMAGGLPLSERVLMLSGRASFELVQKALMARIPVVAAVGAPSSLAVELAEAFGLTLAGFVRGASFNVYCHPERIVSG
jgi:FdhD protein